MDNPFLSRPAKSAPAADFAEVEQIGPDGLRIKLDGEDEAGQKFYRRLASYTNPAKGDRVYIIRTSGTLLVVGKVE